MEIEEVIRALKNIGYYHEIVKQQCYQLLGALEKMQQAADSSAACKKTRKSKKIRYEEFKESDMGKSILAKRELLFQKKINNKKTII